MITHDLQSTAPSRPHRGSGRRKIVAIGSMEEMLKAENPWVRSYFRARSRIVSLSAATSGEQG